MEYDPKKVTALFGALPLLGHADGEFIRVNFLGEGDRAMVGAGGATCLVRSHDKRAEVTVRFMAANDEGRAVLSALLAFYNGGNPMLPFAVNSRSTGETLAGGSAVMKKPPEAVFGVDHPVREVTFVLPECRMQTIPVSV